MPNKLPQANKVTLSGLEDQVTTIVLSGTDKDGTIASYTLASLPSSGALYLDAAHTTLAAVNVTYASNTFYFVPAANFSGSVSFNYSVTDNQGGVSPAAMVTVTLAAVNDAPVVDLNGSDNGSSAVAEYFSTGAAIRIVPSATVADIDHPTSFSGGSLRVAVTQSGTSTDQLGIATDATVTTSPGGVFVSGLKVGTIAVGHTGANGSDLVISLSNGATPASMSTLLQHLSYRNSSTSLFSATRGVTVSLTDGGGTANGGTDTGSATATINIISNHVPTGTVSISGTATEDQVLSASNTITDADGLGTIGYQWQRNGSNIAGATGSTYTLGDNDVGASIRVVASYTDGHGTAESVASAATATVVNVNDSPTGTVSIAGTATEDQVLTASNTLVDADGLGPISYQWQRVGSNIVGATGSSYTLGDADVGASITVVASYTDGHGTAESVASAQTGPVVNVNDPPTKALPQALSAPSVIGPLLGPVPPNDGITVGDVNGDGNADVVAEVYDSDEVTVYLSHGDGTFNAPAVYSNGASNYLFVGLGDLNNDGLPDIADPNGTGLAILLNNGDGTFGPSTTIPNVFPAGVAIGDLNGDGNADLVVANQALSVMLGNGDGTFGSPTNYATAYGPFSTKIADLNGDGNADLVVAAYYSNTISVSLGNGSGAFAIHTDYNALIGNPTALAIGDFNGDGLADIVAADVASNELAVFVNQGDGTYGTPILVSAPTGPSWGIGAADFNGDGKLDLAVPSPEGLGVLLGNGNGTFSVGATYGQLGPAFNAQTTDVNGDGLADIVFTSSLGLAVMLGQSAVSISGTATEDQVLTASNTLVDADGLGPISYQWQRDGSNIVGATGSSYTLGDADVGASITVVASYTDGHGTAESVASAPTGPVVNVNDAPVVTMGNTIGYTEQAAAVVASSGLTLSDPGNATLAGATVSISSGWLSGDTLSFVNQNGISGSWDAGAGTLTLTGTASLANYQAALRSVTFSNATNDDPGGARTVSWVVSDGTASSNTGTTTVNVTGVNDAPTILGAVTVASSSISFTAVDPDNASLALGSPFADAFSNPAITSGAAATVFPSQQSTTVSGTLQVTDGSASANVVGLYLGTGGNDTASAPNGSLSNAMYGFGGNDTLTGSSNADTIVGGTGADTISAGGGDDTIDLANGDFAAGELINGGGNTDAIVLTNATTVDFTSGTISNVEILTGSSGNDTVTMWATQWAGFTTIDLVGGADTLNVVATGDISAQTMPTVSNVTTGNLTGTGNNDTLTLRGGQLDAIIHGSGTINLGGGTDTINLTSTSAALNTLGVTDASIQGVEAISAATVAAGVTIALSGQSEGFGITGSDNADSITGGTGADTISAGGGNDTVTGGAGDDTLNGGAGNDTIIGGAGDDTITGGAGTDTFFGGPGSDTFYGNSTQPGSILDGSTDTVDYSLVTGLNQGIVVNWAAGTVVGQVGIIDTDHLIGIEDVFGTAFDDVFDATGYSSALANAGDFSAYQLVRGGGGNDIITGNITGNFGSTGTQTEALYSDATSGITANMSATFGSGTVTGGGIGTDTLAGVNRIVGSNFNDTFFGSDNGNEIFDGYTGGDDVFHGGGGLDKVEYDGSNRQAIAVDLANGVVTGRVVGSNIGTDTLDSIENIRGSELDDLYDATGFSASSTNHGSSGTFNQFEGQGGADSIIGNNNTAIAYFNASAGITVSMSGTGTGSVSATYGGNTAVDTFSGVGTIFGSNFADAFAGSAGADNFQSQSGDDTLTGNGGGDTLTGGAGNDTFNYAAVTDSQAGAFDTITDFLPGQDKIDLSALVGLGNTLTTVVSAPANIAANSLVAFVSGVSTILYANTSAAPQAAASASMEIHLTGVTTLANADIFHHA